MDITWNEGFPSFRIELSWAPFLLAKRMNVGDRTLSRVFGTEKMRSSLEEREK